MKKIELVWNIIYYFIFKGYANFFKKLNPYYSNNNSKDSRALSLMFILSLLIGFDFFCAIEAIRNKTILNSSLFIIIAVIFALINYFLLVYKDKCLSYFKEFESMPRDWKKKWGWISFAIILMIFISVPLSFKIMDYSLHR